MEVFVMRKIHLILGLAAAILSSQAVFADDQDMDSKPCAAIATACVSAGFAKDENSAKKFWQDCMKPVILGQKVEGVNVDAATVKSCRSDKIEKMKKEVKEFQKVSS